MNRMSLRSVVVVKHVLALVSLAACASHARLGDDPLRREAEDLLADPRVTATVLDRLASTNLRDYADIASRYEHHENYDVQAPAWRMLLNTGDEARRIDLIEQGLVHPNHLVRAICATAARGLPASSSRIDEGLRSILSNDPFAHIVRNACVSQVQVHGATGASEVFQLLERRGSEWVDVALPALAAYPRAEFAEVFTRATDSNDSDRICLGQRGLVGLALPLPSRQEDQSSLMTDTEFGEYWMKEARTMGALTEVRWSDLMAEAASAQVVVIGEAHSVGHIVAAEIYLLSELATRWEAPMLVYEVPMQNEQAAVITEASRCKFPCTIVEERSAIPRSAHPRDEEAKRGLVDLVHQNERSGALVIYGEGHRESFLRHLRASGITAVGVNLSGGNGIQGDAIRAARTLDLRGKVFRYESGTYYVPVVPYSLQGCPALDELLAERNRSRH